MRIALLHGADKNAGDFLIKHRSRVLLNSLLPDAEFIEFNRNKSLSDCLGRLNSCDCIVFAGGPAYVPRVYPDRFPLVDNLADIKPPMFALGMGGRYPSVASAMSARFSDASKIFIERLQGDGFGLGCRDILTRDMLVAQGVNDVALTGCPAWYDLEDDEAGTLPSDRPLGDAKRIAVSDPAAMHNFNVARCLIEELQLRFPDAKIKLIFHRGWAEDEFSPAELAAKQIELRRWANERGVETVDISYSHAGFSVYDESDVHIGFRVHAHIYNLSRHHASYLIEEDSRGYGANETIGVPHVALPGVSVKNYAVDRSFRMMRGIRKRIISSGGGAQR